MVALQNSSTKQRKMETLENSQTSESLTPSDIILGLNKYETTYRNGDSEPCNIIIIILTHYLPVFSLIHCLQAMSSYHRAFDHPMLLIPTTFCSISRLHIPSDDPPIVILVVLFCHRYLSVPELNI